MQVRVVGSDSKWTFWFEKGSLPISVKTLELKLEAQIEPWVFHVDKQRALPPCVATVAPHVAAAQQRTPITD